MYLSIFFYDHGYHHHHSYLLILCLENIYQYSYNDNTSLGKDIHGHKLKKKRERIMKESYSEKLGILVSGCDKVGHFIFPPPNVWFGITNMRLK